MSALPVDIDTETIQFDGQWLGREDLAKAIRGMLDSGNYNIGRHSAALESLTQALQDVRTLAFRASPELAEALTQAAAKQGTTAGALIRAAVAAHLSGASAPAGAAVPGEAPKKSGPEGKRPTNPEIPIAVVAAPPSAPELPPEPKTPPTPPPGLKPAAPPPLLAGPGALRAAGVPAPSAPTTPQGSAAAAAGPSVVVDQSLQAAGEVVTEAASPEEAANAVDLTPKKQPEEPDAVERRWFGN